MIYDKITSYQNYLDIHPKFKKAFQYIIETDFSKIEPGKYEIDGSNLFALVQEFETKNEEACKLEAHLEYIDIQYVYIGTEMMGHCLLYEQNPINEGYKNDVAFFNDHTVNMKVSEGEFIIFYPHDLHKPCIKYIENSTVKKIVVKVKI
ncbi:YhcH/YjgK/YiaL family protein [Roseimarinus sediminis]|uniref:YhcH/YjgK/YiaL family protein n=1 Tax=Roseimarinus sediminis TaxID=1610899 RepID=UPI003D19E7DB